MSSTCLLRLVTMVLVQMGHTPPPAVGSCDTDMAEPRRVFFLLNVQNIWMVIIQIIKTISYENSSLFDQ